MGDSLWDLKYEWNYKLVVIILGIVEGITEWLPISSTGHMRLVDALCHYNSNKAFTIMFSLVIQLGLSRQ